jgi:hypothetical protein
MGVFPSISINYFYPATSSSLVAPSPPSTTGGYAVTTVAAGAWEERISHADNTREINTLDFNIV